MTIANTYPVFEADQVLTSDHLNSLVDYLDQQDRLTRMKLIGSGIVCGLEIDPGREGIKVSKGCALTSQGFMVLHCETVYTHFVSYIAPPFPGGLQLVQQCTSKPSVFTPFYGERFGQGILELIAEKDVAGHSGVSDPVALSQVASDFLDKYVIVLFLEAEQLNLKNCDTNDCNDKGSRMTFQVKALLVEKNVLDKIGREQGRSAPPQVNTVYPVLKRYNVPSQKLTTASDVLNGFRELADKETLTTIAVALKNAARQYQYLLDNESATVFDTTYDHLAALRDELLKNHPIFIQYFYDHLDDIIKAYYEFHYLAEHASSECCMDEMRFPLHIMLGEANQATVHRRSSYREYFIYSPLFGDQQHRVAQIRLLFTRLKLLISQFSIDSMLGIEKKQVKITPSRFGKTSLSNRCIPYYYELGEPPQELHRYWNFEKSKRGEETHNLGYNAAAYQAPFPIANPLLYDMEAFNFFRIEGHIGKHINEALPIVKQQQQENNLAFEVVALSADYIGTLVRGEEPKCIIQDLESDYRVLIAEFVCRLHDAFCKVGRTEHKPASIFTGTLSSSFSNARAGNVTTAAGVSAAASLLSSITAEEEEEEMKILKTTLLINPEVIAHPFVSTLVSEYHLSKAYRKGDTLSRLCKPARDTVGAAYIAIINRNNGQFRNPIIVSTSILGTFLRNGFFELIDSIESMFEILMNNELADLEITKFKTAYERYEICIGNVAARLARIGINTQIFLSTCIVEKMEALKNEYLRRTAQYRLAKNFSHYFSRHGGVEHKAGVPRGGTFILVYHEQRRRQLFDVRSILVNKELSSMLLRQFPALLQSTMPLHELESKTEELQLATQFKDPELFLRLNDVVGKYLNECNDLPEARRKALEAIIKLPPQRATFNLADGMVIADFYVPYLCCSDCPPIAYIIAPPPVTEDQTPILRIAKESFCTGDTTEFQITASPAGGNLEGEGVKRRSDGSFVFVPAGLASGTYTITYTLNQKTASVTIEVNATPGARFTTTRSINDGVMIVEIKNQSTGVGEQGTYEWLLDDEPFFEKKDPDPLILKLETLPHTLVMRASNAGCSAEFSEEIRLETEAKLLKVCSTVRKQALETEIPADATIVVIKNEGGIMNDGLVILPSSMNVTKTTIFNVSYAINGRQTDVEITVVFANADFTMEISRSTGTSALITTLALKSLDPTITKSEWQVKQGNNVIAQTGRDISINMEASQLVLGRNIDITHAVEVSATTDNCGQKKTFKITRPIVDKKLNQGSFNNDFTIE